MSKQKRELKSEISHAVRFWHEDKSVNVTRYTVSFSPPRAVKYKYSFINKKGKTSTARTPTTYISGTIKLYDESKKCRYIFYSTTLRFIGESISLQPFPVSFTKGEVSHHFFDKQYFPIILDSLKNGIPFELKGNTITFENKVHQSEREKAKPDERDIEIPLKS